MERLPNICLNSHTFGTDHIQRSYVLFTEVEFSYYTQSNIAICPANTAILSRQVLSCESSLFFQTTDSLSLRRRKLLLHHTTPLLQRYDSTWIFHFPKYQHIILRCWKNGTWISTTKQLQGNGIKHNSSARLLTADEFQALPRMCGIFQTPRDYIYPTKSQLSRATNSRHAKKASPQKSRNYTTSRNELLYHTKN